MGRDEEEWGGEGWGGVEMVHVQIVVSISLRETSQCLGHHESM